MLTMRAATPSDTDFIAETDLESDRGVFNYMIGWSEADALAHKERMRGFTTEPDKATWILVEPATNRRVGLGMCEFRTCRRNAPRFDADVAIMRWLDDDRIDEIDFCEVFQLWVAPEYRRQGWGTALKRAMEQECLRRGVGLIYTHTPEFKPHVVELNRKLGYKEIRRGRLFTHTDIVMVSLAKRLVAAKE